MHTQGYVSTPIQLVMQYAKFYKQENVLASIATAYFLYWPIHVSRANFICKTHQEHRPPPHNIIKIKVQKEDKERQGNSSYIPLGIWLL